MKFIMILHLSESHNNICIDQDTFWYTHSLHVFITIFVRTCFVISFVFSIMHTDTMSKTKLHLDKILN